MTNVQQLLADEGTTANAFATFPLCCPARATLLTGPMRAQHRGAVSLPLGGFAALDHTQRPPHLAAQGDFATAHVGKYMNCHGSTHPSCGTGPVVPPRWDRWFGLIDHCPHNYGYMSFDVLGRTHSRHLGPPTTVYQTDVLADRGRRRHPGPEAPGRPFLP